MDNEKRKILDMLAEGKINADQAERLLTAIEGDPGKPVRSKDPESGAPRYLYVQVDPKEGSRDSEQVKITVPLALLKAGISLFSLLPKNTRKDVEHAMDNKGFDFDLNKLNPEELETMIAALEELEVNVDTADTTVRIFAG